MQDLCRRFNGRILRAERIQCSLFPVAVSAGQEQLVVNPERQHVGEPEPADSLDLASNPLFQSARRFFQHDDTSECCRCRKPASQSFAIQWIVRMANEDSARKRSRREIRRLRLSV